MDQKLQPGRFVQLSSARAAERLPPHAYFVLSAIFHYLGPAFAVLLFARVAPLGVVWMRIATAAVIFGAWRRPWRYFARQNWTIRRNVIQLGVVLGCTNACFYLAIARLPLGTVGAIEFLGPIGLAAIGLATARNYLALAMAVIGVGLLSQARLASEEWGLIFAFANCALFVLYIVFGHRAASDGGGQGIDRLSAAMLVALPIAFAIGFRPALPALSSPLLIGAGVGVGITSSVIPYVCDQLAMARLQRSTFALLLALLPATASLIGVIVLHQIPKPKDVLGIALIIAAVAMHRERQA